MPRALVVEDDEGIAAAVAFALQRDGMTAEIASTLDRARWLANGVDLVIVDLGLPDGSGYELVGELTRAVSAPRIVVLTSRSEEVDCVAALEAGADDFVSKPFSLRALVARARAVLRRGRGSPESMAREEAGALSFDSERRRVSYAGSELALTKTEFNLLTALARSPGRVFTRAQLVERVWGNGYALTERTVDSHVKALRRKLEAVGAPESLLASVRGVGFKLSEVA